MSDVAKTLGDMAQPEVINVSIVTGLAAEVGVKISVGTVACRRRGAQPVAAELSRVRQLSGEVCLPGECGS